MLLFLTTFSITSSYAEEAFKINGNVANETGKEALHGASVYFVEANKGAITDANGWFSIDVPAGTYTVKVSYVGYDSREFKVTASRGQELQFKLSGNIELDEVVVTSKGKDINLTRTKMGVESLSQLQIKQLPAMMGEVDVLKAVQLLPGVQPTSDGGSGFSVRGGSADQNLILLDNSPVYNASHLMGIFSTFNNDVVSGIELYKGDMPLKHGGRLSSLLDIHTKSDMPERFSMTGGLGLIFSRLTIEAPLGNKTSVLVGGRRSYADVFLRMNKDYKDYDLYFYDTNFKLTHQFSEKDKIELNAYYGKDLCGMEKQRFGYGNTTASLSWGHKFSENLLSKLSFNLSDYDYFLESEYENSEMTMRAGLSDYILRLDFTQPVNQYFNLSYGATATIHNFRPGLVTQPKFDDFRIKGSNALETAVYIENESKIADWLTLRYGVRYSTFSNMGSSLVYEFDEEYNPIDSVSYKKGKIYNTYTSFEPRAGVVFRLNDNSSVKANYVHNVQYIQIANNSAAGSPFDMWFSASPNIKPQEVDMVSVGYFHNFNNDMYEASVEAYYKDMTNVIDFGDHSELLLNKYLEGEIRTGTGKAYGVEFMIKKNTGRLTGFANYTLSRSERTFSEINDGKTYLAPFDKTHFINVTATYQFNKKHSVSAAFIYATGNPTTYPVGRMEIDGSYVPIYSGRNEYRRPDYHRLDLSWTYVPKPNSTKRWKGEWNFSVFNAYNQHNPWTISYNRDQNSTPYAEMIYMFGILPSVTYNFKF